MLVNALLRVAKTDLTYADQDLLRPWLYSLRMSHALQACAVGAAIALYICSNRNRSGTGEPVTRQAAARWWGAV
jgi:hypothetical protein